MREYMYMTGGEYTVFVSGGVVVGGRPLLAVGVARAEAGGQARKLWAPSTQLPGTAGGGDQRAVP